MQSSINIKKEKKEKENERAKGYSTMNECKVQNQPFESLIVRA